MAGPSVTPAFAGILDCAKGEKREMKDSGCQVSAQLLICSHYKLGPVSFTMDFYNSSCGYRAQLSVSSKLLFDWSNVTSSS